MLTALLLPGCTAPAPSPLEAEAFRFCRAVAAMMGLEAKVDPARVKLFRAQAASLLSGARRGLAPESLALPLLEAAQGSLDVLAGDGVIGERRYGRAVQRMGMRWRERRKILPAESPQRVPELESLALLCELGGLRGTAWREEALRLRFRLVKGTDGALEKDLALAVEERYGPWLTVAETEPMVEFSGYLAQLWLREPSSETLTHRVAAVALKSSAESVWRLAARKGSEAFRVDLGALLERLDANVLMSTHENPAMNLGAALLGTPVDSGARRLLRRMDGTAIAAKSPEFRRRIARLLGDWELEAEQLFQALRTETSPEARLRLVWEASSILRIHAHLGLLQEATRVLQADGPVLARPDKPQGQFWEALAEFSSLQRKAGNREEAEALIRLRLHLEEPAGRDPEARLRLLASLGRFVELEEALGPPQPQEGLELLGLRFRTALGRGREATAREALVAWIDGVLRLDLDEPVPSLPGLAAGQPLLRDRGEKLNALAARLGSRLMPGQEALLKREPEWILAALDPVTRDQPRGMEQNLRWRLNRLENGPGKAGAIKELRGEAESRLGNVHSLVAELLIKEAEAQADPDPALLERARGILRGIENPPNDLRLAICNALAGIYAREGDGQALAREGRFMLEILEDEATPDPEQVEGLMTLLVMGLWREQRLEELLDVFPRLEHLEARLAKRPASGSILEYRAPLFRAARLQAQLRAAGLI